MNNETQLFSKLKDCKMNFQDDNRWVVIADNLEWNKLEEANRSSGKRRPRQPFRVMLGCLIIQRYLDLTDDELMRELSENPYYRYFVGLPMENEQIPFSKTVLKGFSDAVRIDVGKLLAKDKYCRKFLKYGAAQKVASYEATISSLRSTIAYNDFEKELNESSTSPLSLENKQLRMELDDLRQELSEYKEKAEKASLEEAPSIDHTEEDLLDITQMTEEQLGVYGLAMHGKNLFITGGAGTGKSYLLQRIIANLIKERKNVIVGAPTGMAALNVGGVTLHRLFGLPIGLVEDIHIHGGNISNLIGRGYEVIQKANVLVIDEISMCRADAFERIANIVKYEEDAGHHMQVILCGDFYQLAPVVPAREKEYFKDVLHNEEGWAFLSSSWKNLSIETCQLTKVIRQENPDFANALNEIREGKSNGLGYICSQTYRNRGRGVMLCGKNKVAQAINERELMSLGEYIEVFDAVVSKNTEDLDPVKEISRITDPHIELCVGARVIITINDPSGMNMYHNGSMGNIVNIDDDVVEVRLDEGDIVSISKFLYQVYDYTMEEDKDTGLSRLKRKVIFAFEQIPLKLGWAITIHKSQGQTYDHMILNTDSLWRADGLLYVGLSRVTSTSGLALIGANKYMGHLARFLKASKSVREFYHPKKK